MMQDSNQHPVILYKYIMDPETFIEKAIHFPTKL